MYLDLRVWIIRSDSMLFFERETGVGSGGPSDFEVSLRTKLPPISEQIWKVNFRCGLYKGSLIALGFW